ncbi:MAG: ATP cone domain-containing protein [Patescibacteria group bacterium]
MATHLVRKLDGALEPFDSSKLVRSLKNAGATEATVVDIVGHIEREMKDGMTTSHIYRHARRLLKKHADSPVAARYSLRRAVLELGPSGFPFETLLGEVFKKKGYNVRVGEIMKGHCVDHEIDVIAHNDKELILVEAKFHNAQGFKTDVKVALYIHGRFLDLEAGGFEGLVPRGGKAQSWVVTNTKFTENAIRYGTCVGMHMIGWGYPSKGNVQDLIEEAGLHPLSCLTTLTGKEKETLYQNGVVLCRGVVDNPNVLERAGVTGPKVATVLAEANRLCVPFTAEDIKHDA